MYPLASLSSTPRAEFHSLGNTFFFSIARGRIERQRLKSNTAGSPVPMKDVQCYKAANGMRGRERQTQGKVLAATPRTHFSCTLNPKVRKTNLFSWPGYVGQVKHTLGYRVILVPILSTLSDEVDKIGTRTAGPPDKEDAKG